MLVGENMKTFEIKDVIFFATGKYLNKIAIPNAGKIPPAVFNPLINHTGI